jgi:hypothetical protein
MRSLVESSLQLSITPFASHLNQEHSRPKGVLRWTVWPTDEILAELEYRLEREGYSGWTCLLSFALEDDPEPVEVHQRISMVKTRPHFGGRRWWFRCPGDVECGRRCHKLYLPWGGSGFACRGCHGLIYSSTLA